MQHLLDGYFTLQDEEMYRLLALLAKQEGIRVEPSAAAGVPGIFRVLRHKEYLDRMNLTDEKMKNAVHIAWLTGGSMVPEAEMASYIAKGEKLL